MMEPGRRSRTKTQRHCCFWETAVLFSMVVALYHAPVAAGVEIHVPDDFALIQGAVDAASQGDTIIVKDGTYSENVEFKGKAVTVRSENGPRHCIVYGRDHSRPVFSFVNNEGHSSTLEGLTLTGGSSPRGGGIYCRLASPTIRNCIIAENNALRQEGDDSGGGGIYLDQSGAIVEDCLIRENTAGGGGHGGGVYLRNSFAVIRSCRIIGNLAVAAAALPGSGRGGGIYTSSYAAASQPTIENCLIAENMASGDEIDDPGRGGGIYCRHSSPTISRCTIIGNLAVGAPGSQGRGGGIGCRSGSSPTIVNSVIANNLAIGWLQPDSGSYTPGHGGGLYCREDSSPTVVNCTIAYNANALVTTAGQDGAGICLRDHATALVTNAILWGNDPVQISSDGAQPAVSFSNVQGGYPGNGNISADPQFLGGEDYHLSADSPCIDVATPTGAPAHDIDGESRPWAAAYDMGADEFMQIFADVAPEDWADKYLRSLFYSGITKGCDAARYCPGEPVTRAQMAVFIVRAMDGEDFASSSDPYFSDVTSSSWAFGYIQRLRELEITTGYPDGRYGPEDLVTREQMASFLIRAIEGNDPTCSPHPYFSDVPAGHWAFAYIQRLKELGVTTGCTTTDYCPADLVSRDQMAAFLARAFLDIP